MRQPGRAMNSQPVAWGTIMTPRERWQAVLRGHIPDRVPTDYWATPEATERLLEHTGCADVWALCRRRTLWRCTPRPMPRVCTADAGLLIGPSA